ncbi:MAG: NUDIX domain-containing protein [Clostridiales bacterium]|nr:NUDIX domain-containing protein [Clostridiales bacterium]
MERLDVVDENGMPTGETVTREEAHRDGIRHRTAHVWIARRRGDSVEILLQKRCMAKDSFPGCYDISSAGHIPAGVDFVPSALRELSEELGVKATEQDLIDCGMYFGAPVDTEFHGKPFHDRQISRVFLMWLDREPAEFSLQPEEIESVMWMEYWECRRAVAEGTIQNCMHVEELEMLRRHLYDF